VADDVAPGDDTAGLLDKVGGDVEDRSAVDDALGEDFGELQLARHATTIKVSRFEFHVFKLCDVKLET
jgi:hypothetical protein